MIATFAEESKESIDQLFSFSTTFTSKFFRSPSLIDGMYSILILNGMNVVFVTKRPYKQNGIISSRHCLVGIMLAY